MTRQCVWKPSRKEVFIEAARLFHLDLQRNGIPNDIGPIENEVNVYVGKDDGGVSTNAMRSMLGIILLRNGMSQGGDEGNAVALAKKLGRLGKRVPVFELTVEYPHNLHMWDSSKDVDLTAKPYSLWQIWPCSVPGHDVCR